MSSGLYRYVPENSESTRKMNKKSNHNINHNYAENNLNNLGKHVSNNLYPRNRKRTGFRSVSQSVPEAFGPSTRRP